MTFYKILVNFVMLKLNETHFLMFLKRYFNEIPATTVYKVIILTIKYTHTYITAYTVNDFYFLIQ